MTKVFHNQRHERQPNTHRIFRIHWTGYRTSVHVLWLDLEHVGLNFVIVDLFHFSSFALIAPVAATMTTVIRLCYKYNIFWCLPLINCNAICRYKLKIIIVTYKNEVDLLIICDSNLQQENRYLPNVVKVALKWIQCSKQV